MALVLHVSQSKVFHVFLNISFLFFLFCFFFFTTHPYYSSALSHANSTIDSGGGGGGGGCKAMEELSGNKAKCSYLKKKTQEDPCLPQGYIDYLRLFYCACGGNPFLGYALLAFWLLVLFYVLGNTASEYFCSTLESLSKALRLSPAVAGVTLLSLGNGAPDVFASVVSFTNGSGGEVGLSSVLGGAFFVSSVVVGVVSLSVDGRTVAVDRSCFVRDLCFFAAALASLLAILVLGRVSLWAATCFVSLYFVYVFVASAAHCRRNVIGDVGAPLLDGGVENEEEEAAVAIDAKGDLESRGEPILPELKSPDSGRFHWFLYLIKMPLYLPRRLTIPVVCEETWSKPFAVASATCAPILLAALWNSQRGGRGSKQTLEIYFFGGLLGIVLGITALETTKISSPPKRFLLPWLAGGFLMSVVWAYITAQELVSLLVSLGYIFGMSPSILGLTVLAWGNSVGDLMANAAMAVNGGQHGAQVAISGCYAGPMFNTVVGLGVPLFFSSWYAHPSPFVIHTDPTLYETLGFLVAGLLWALVILTSRDMKLDRVLGVGLLAIYLCFLSLRISQSLGWVQFHGSLSLTSV